MTCFRMVLVLAIIAVAAPCGAAPDDAVTAVGLAFYEPGREAAAREKALDDAKRLAVEKAVGTRVESSALVENFQMTRDMVLSRSAGYIRELTVIREDKSDGAYEVEIEARVAVADLVSDMDRFRQLVQWQQNPRVAVLLAEDMDADRTAAGRKASSRLSTRLRDEGFQVFADPKALDRMGMWIRLGVDVASSESEAHGVRIRINEVSTHADVIRPGDREILASAAAVQTVPGSNRLKALDNGARKCLDTMWGDLRAQLVRLWEKELYGQRRVALTVTGVPNRAEAIRLTNVLQDRVHGVVAARLTAFANGAADIDLQYRGWPAQLVNEMEMAYFKAQYFDWTLRALKGNRIGITLK